MRRRGRVRCFVRRNVRLQPMFFGGAARAWPWLDRGRRMLLGLLGWAGRRSWRELADAESAGWSCAIGWSRGILAAVDEAGVNGGSVARVANTSNLYFDHVEAEALVIALDLKGLAVSGGSACQSGATEPSHVLTAMGLSEARARASVRFSLSRLTTEEEVERAVELVPAAVARLRELSPSWRKAVATVKLRLQVPGDIDDDDALIAPQAAGLA